MGGCVVDGPGGRVPDSGQARAQGATLHARRRAHRGWLPNHRHLPCCSSAPPLTSYSACISCRASRSCRRRSRSSGDNQSGVHWGDEGRGGRAARARGRVGGLARRQPCRLGGTAAAGAGSRPLVPRPPPAHPWVVQVIAVGLLKLAAPPAQKLDALPLDRGALHAVLAVQELDDLAHGVAHRAVVPGRMGSSGVRGAGRAAAQGHALPRIHPGGSAERHRGARCAAPCPCR